MCSPEFAVFEGRNPPHLPSLAKLFEVDSLARLANRQ